MYVAEDISARQFEKAFPRFTAGAAPRKTRRGPGGTAGEKRNA